MVTSLAAVRVHRLAGLAIVLTSSCLTSGVTARAIVEASGHDVAEAAREVLLVPTLRAARSEVPYEFVESSEASPAPSAGARVTVLDADGQAVPRATVALVSLVVRESFVVGETIEATGVTDTAGRVDLVGWPARRELYLDVRVGDVRPDLFDAERAWDARDTTVALRRAFPVRGRVVDPLGRPLCGARVHVLPEDRTDDRPGFGGYPEITGEDGRFLWRFETGRTVRLKAVVGRTFERSASRERDDRLPRSGTPQEVATGSLDTLLQLDPGCDLDVDVRDLPGPHPRTVVHLRAERASRPRDRRYDYFDWMEDEAVYHAPADADGKARFFHVDPERTYAVWAVTEDPATCGLATGVHPREGPVRLEPRAATTLHCRLDLPEHALPPVVIVESGDVEFMSHEVEAGICTIRGLPADRRWCVECRLTVQLEETAPGVRDGFSCEDRVEVDAPAGSTPSVTLRPRRVGPR